MKVVRFQHPDVRVESSARPRAGRLKIRYPTDHVRPDVKISRSATPNSPAEGDGTRGRRRGPRAAGVTGWRRRPGAGDRSDPGRHSGSAGGGR